MITRWKYRFICWFFDGPDSLQRRVKVENALLAHAEKGTSPTPSECRELARALGVPRWFVRARSFMKTPNFEVTGAAPGKEQR